MQASDPASQTIKLMSNDIPNKRNMPEMTITIRR